MGHRLTTAALIEQDDTIYFRVEKRSVIGLGSGAGTAVHEYHRNTVRHSRLFHIQYMRFVDFQPVSGIRLNSRI
jgi:hypothetical protein